MSSGNRKVVFPNGEILTGQAADAYLEDLFGKQEAADGAYRAESRAEAARTGKEPFSREKVQALWHPDRWPGDEIDEDEWRSIEEEYYAQRGRCQTIASFIPYLVMQEQWRDPGWPPGWEEELEATFGKQPPPGGTGGDGSTK